MNIDDTINALEALAEKVDLQVVNRNGYLDVIPINKMEYEWEVIPPGTFNKELIGNWFLYMNRDGDIFVTKDEPQRTESGAVHLKNISTCKSGWMQLTSSDAISIAPAFPVGDWTLKPSDFNNLRLPRLQKNSIVEIEIMPSGKVYFY